MILALSVTLSYKTNKGYDFFVAPIHENVKIFNMTLVWINTGCILSVDNCDNTLGQIYVNLDYGKKHERVDYFIENIPLYDSNNSNVTISKYWEVISVYWGELDALNMSEIELTSPY